ncbi:MAG: PAS domain-containing protein, partial [Anaerolineae bacterium]|nr:PAS domain-containing protein [Anaerolineae bacterium]
MSDHQQSPPEVNTMITRVNLFGSITEKLFSRLYAGLRNRSGANDRRKIEEIQKQKARMIAERNKQLRQALRRHEVEVSRLNGILATIDEGIIMQDMEGRIVLINDAAQKLLGTQKNFWESELGTLFDAYRDVVKVDSELAPLGEPTRIQVNNRILGAQLAAVADAGGERLGTMIVLRDVTHDAMLERLKDQFVTAISHELRTPMTVIKGVGEVIANQGEGGPTSKRLLDTLTRNVDTLDRMVVELLDISEMGAGTFSVRQDAVKIEPLLWSVVNSMATELKRAKLDVAFMARDIEQLI